MGEKFNHLKLINRILKLNSLVNKVVINNKLTKIKKTKYSLENHLI